MSMSGPRFRLSIALLALTMVVASTALWFVSRRLLSRKGQSQQLRSAPAQNPPETTTLDVYADGVTEEGYARSSVLEHNSDGTATHSLIVIYHSPKRATLELQKRLDEAVEVISREPVLDEKARQIGEKVVATFAPYRGSSAVWVELLYTEGSKFVSERKLSPEVSKESPSVDVRHSSPNR